MITKEKIEQRIASLKQARDQHVANANMVNGHLIEAEYWLSQLEIKDDGNPDASGDSQHSV